MSDDIEITDEADHHRFVHHAGIDLSPAPGADHTGSTHPFSPDQEARP